VDGSFDARVKQASGLSEPDLRWCRPGKKQGVADQRARPQRSEAEPCGAVVVMCASLHPGRPRYGPEDGRIQICAWRLEGWDWGCLSMAHVRGRQGAVG
jgi:hypothetical protein